MGSQRQRQTEMGKNRQGGARVEMERGRRWGGGGVGDVGEEGLKERTVYGAETHDGMDF